MLTDLRPAFKVMILMSILLVLGVLTAAGSGEDMQIDKYGEKMILLFKILQVVAVIFIFILPAGLFSLLFTKDRLRYPRWNVPPNLILLLIGALVFIVGIPMIAWLEQLNREMTLPASLSGLEHWMQQSEANAGKLTEAFLADTSVGGLILNLFVIAFMAALSEELFFRGVLQKAFTEAFGNYHVAIWVTAILFSAFHMQFYGFVPRMIMGAVLGYLFVWSGSLWVNIFAHFVNNGVAVVISWMIKRGSITEEMQNGPVTISAVSGLISLALVAGLMFLVFKFRKKEEEPALMQTPPEQVQP